MSKPPFDQAKYDTLRYEVLCTGYPKDGESPMGRAGDQDRAEQMATAFLLAPSTKNVRIVDRENGATTVVIFTVERYKID